RATHAEPARMIPRNLSAGISRALDHIEENFAERISVEDLSELAELSIFRFVTVFKRQVGLPPHRYICHRRVREAKVLLRAGVAPAIAAIEAGFFDQSHLSRHFKSICGMTPGQYVAHAAAEATHATEHTSTRGDRVPLGLSA